MAGIYREVFELSNSGTAANPITIRAYPGDEGDAVISGSDVVTGWTYEGNNTWSVARQALPQVIYPSGWPDYGPYSRRREMVFVEGTPLIQVLSSSALAENQFWVDVSGSRYYVRHSGNLNDRLVEIATRDRGIHAYWIDHVRWIGLKIQHVANDLALPAVAVRSYHEFRNCQIVSNNMEGIKPYKRARIFNSIVSSNGGVGINLSGSDCLLDSNESSYNSWRYGPGWHAGGVKMIYDRPTNNKIARHTANYNNGPGIWLDHAGSDNIVESSVMIGNQAIGLFIEATQGPTWAVNNIIVDTQPTDTPYPQCEGAGIAIRDSFAASLINNTIVDVEGPGICISGDERNGGIDYTADTSVYNNIIVNSGSAAIRFWVWGAAREEPRIGSHHFDNNLYYGHSTTVVFPDIDKPWGDFYWSLAEWQTNRSEDLQSLSLPPDFIDPIAYNFALSPGSPAIDAGDNFSIISQDIMGRRRPIGASTDIGAYEFLLSSGDATRPEPDLN